MPIPSAPSKNAPKTAKERVYLQLREWIIDGTLKPGEKISDQEIAQYFSVSRTPIREALQLLAEQKLVCIFPGKESRVAPIDMENICQIYQILAELHVLALRFAYPAITEDTIAELQKINDHARQIADKQSPGELLEMDARFHQVFLQMAGSAFLSDFTKILDTHIERVENLYFSEKANSAANTVAHHQAIIDALKKRDLPQALEAMRANWTHMLEVLGT